MLYYFKNRGCVMKKKYKYENSTVFMAIALLAMFIVFPPLARIFYPKEEMSESLESRVFLYCSKESKQEGFRVTSSVYYLNNQVQKNSINFFDIKNTEVAPVEINPEGVEPLVQNKEIVAALENKKTIFAELEFFRHLQGVNFVDNRTSYSVEVNGDSLIVNEGNEELKNYLMDIDSQEAFYIGLDYSCYREDTNS